MNKNELEESAFEAFEKRSQRRRKLLPWWIKTFSWIFMVFGFLAFVVMLAGIMGYNLDLSLYGLETYQPISVIGIIVAGLYIFKGLTGFALWFEKDYAIQFGKIDAVLGLLACGVTMIVFPLLGAYGFTLRLEIFLLLPYLLKLHKIQTQWEAIRN